MLFWLFIIVGLIGVGLIVIGKICWNSEKHPFLWYNDDNIQETGWGFVIVAIITIVISLFFISINFMGIDADVAKYHEKYEALTYKMESGACRDEFGLLSKEVIDEIQYWNTDLTYRQNIQDDFWLGIYYPNVYDQFKTIDYESYNRE